MQGACCRGVEERTRALAKRPPINVEVVGSSSRSEKRIQELDARATEAVALKEAKDRLWRSSKHSSPIPMRTQPRTFFAIDKRRWRE